jgi:hypothetical protein
VAGTFVVIEYVTDRGGVNEIGSSSLVVIVSTFSLLIRIVTACLRVFASGAPRGRLISYSSCCAATSYVINH